MSEHEERALTEINDVSDIPAFADEEEESRFWATHGLGPAMLARRPIIPPAALPPTRRRTHSVTIRMDEHLLRALKALAETRKVAYQTLMKDLLSDALRATVPEDVRYSPGTPAQLDDAAALLDAAAARYAARPDLIVNGITDLIVAELKTRPRDAYRSSDVLVAACQAAYVASRALPLRDLPEDIRGPVVHRALLEAAGWLRLTAKDRARRAADAARMVSAAP